MENIYRSHNCNQLNLDNLGQTIMLSGWVSRKRDHGGLLFIDIRDNFGLTQLIFEPDMDFFNDAENVKVESCIKITGEVLARDEDAVNLNLSTGKIEVKVKGLEVLSQAEELPLPVFGEPEYPEDIRLKYRYIDLRRNSIHARMIKRSKIISKIRNLMEEANFNEFQTPILTASSPEGARDFIVPSRLHPEKFFALPQAPQIFKQLIMVAGFDKYFQIAPCFRDEDARADRSAGEFYQLDVEMSFVTQDNVLETLEPIIHETFASFAGFATEDKTATATKTATKVDNYPFQRICYDDALLQYGTDKPDLRNPIKMSDVSEVFRDCGFKIFSQILAKDKKNIILAIPAPKGGSRAFCDRMNGWAQKQGLPGMGYIIYGQDENSKKIIAKGPIAKNIGEDKSEQLRNDLNLQSGDAAFFLAGKLEDFKEVAAQARQLIGQELGLMQDGFAFCWIIDFPMYEWDKENKKVRFGHNPFSMPQGGLEALANQDPLSIKADQYDLVCNGYELGSGAIRNHHREIMLKAFAIAGHDESFVQENFNGLYDAFRYGTPPHGGAAFGIERIVMLLLGEQNIREVSLFPLNQQAEDLLLGAPAQVPISNLQDVHIKTVPPIKKET